MSFLNIYPINPILNEEKGCQEKEVRRRPRKGVAIFVVASNEQK